MISKHIKGRKDGRSSAGDSLRYGEGLKVDRETGEYLDKSHRTRLGGFGLVDNGIYANHSIDTMAEIIDLAASEMQATCDLNTRVGEDKKIAHFIFSFDQEKPSETVLRDTEDSMLAALGLSDNHFATFLHNDNGHWHLHMFASRIEKNPPHRGNSLWRDQTQRDKVCREIELRHGLKRDNGLHEIDAEGKIVEIPLAERREKRKEKSENKPDISDRARTSEQYSGEKSFQAWCNEIRIGDRLKHAKSWQELHQAAAAYNCEIRPKGAGLVICPVGEKGGIQLSKVGLKNLPAKFGQFQPAAGQLQATAALARYEPEPTKPAGPFYQQWKAAKVEFKGTRAAAVAELRKSHAQERTALREQHRAELAAIRAGSKGPGRATAVSVAKLEHAAALTGLAADHAAARLQSRRSLSALNPGATFRDYLVKQAGAGDDAALVLTRRYGVDEATIVSRQAEADSLKIVAAVTGAGDRLTPRPAIKHRIERNGSVVFDLGQGRTVVDSAVSRQIQLNHAAATDPAAIETSLRFAVAKFGNTLSLTGSAEFQKLAAETAVRRGLNIKFTDPALEQYRQGLAIKQQPTRTIFPGPRHDTATRNNETRRIPPAHRRDRLHSLRELDVVPNRRQAAAAKVLLPKDVPDHLAHGDAGRRGDDGVRRADGAGTGAGKPAAAVRTRASGAATSRPAGAGDRAPGAAGLRPAVRGEGGPVSQRDAVLHRDRADVTAVTAPLAAPEAPAARPEGQSKAEVHRAIEALLYLRGETVQRVKDGVSYLGEIEISQDGGFAIQNIGRGVVVHDLAQLDGSYTTGQKAEIRYTDGRGSDKLQGPQPERPRRQRLWR